MLDQESVFYNLRRIWSKIVIESISTRDNQSSTIGNLGHAIQVLTK
jgi:hypothetical protein